MSQDELKLGAFAPIASASKRCRSTRNAAPIFIGGAPRSGTSLLRVMLDSHPSIACGPELRAIPALAGFSARARNGAGGILAEQYDVDETTHNAIFAELIMSFLTPFWRRSGKHRIAEKTPANVLHFEELAQLFPEASFIHVVRDGRDVTASMLEMDWCDSNGAPLEMTTDPEKAARIWATHVVSGRRATENGVNIIEIRFEELVNTPMNVLCRILDFLGEAWSDEVLEFHQNPSVSAGVNEASADQIAKPLTNTSIGKWRNKLDATMLKSFDHEAGELLAAIGYA